MKTESKSRVLSPFQVRPRQSQHEASDPVRAEIEKLSKTIDLSVSFEPDSQTSEVFPEIPVAAMICTIKYKDRIIAQGRGFSAISRLNKSIERCAYAAFNGSWMSAAGHACRLFDTMHLNRADEDREIQKRDLSEAYRARGGYDTDAASDRQKNYLRQLLNLRVQDREERAGWEAGIEDLTKEECSQLIERFK